MTAPAVQALLLARQLDQDISTEVFERARNVLRKSRTEEGAFQYSGTVGRRESSLPGSIARSAVCESTLMLLGDGSMENLRASIEAFHLHWDELEKRRKKTGTHKPPYNIAPYYFYYGHRYLAQAIQFLPTAERAAQQEKFKTVLMRTKDEDNTWNDRVFGRSKAYGTAMSVLALLDNVPRAKTNSSIQSETTVRIMRRFESSMQVFSRRSVNVFCAILVALSSMVSLEAQAIQVTAKQLHQLVDEGHQSIIGSHSESARRRI